MLHGEHTDASITGNIPPTKSGNLKANSRKSLQTIENWGSSSSFS